MFPAYILQEATQHRQTLASSATRRAASGIRPSRYNKSAPLRSDAMAEEE